MGHDITLAATGGAHFGGYLATPESGSGPGLVVIQEVFGVNAVMRGITDSFAARGFLAATRTDADASAGYYGVSMENKLDEAGTISKPLMLHVAAHDEFCPPDAQTALHAGLGAHPHVTIHDYPGMSHAFARVGGYHYDAGAADLANTRTLDFLETHLT